MNVFEKIKNGLHEVKINNICKTTVSCLSLIQIQALMKSTLLLFLFAAVFIMNGCGKQDDTILRVYVGYKGQPKLSAKVVIDGVTQNPPQSPFVMTEYTDVNGLAEFNLKDYIKAGSYGGSTVDCTVYLIKNSPSSDTVKTIFVEAFKTTKQQFLFN